MSTFADIKTNIGIDLNDQTSVHFTDSDKTTALQNAYNDIVSLSQCIIKKTTLNFIAQLSYYDFKVDCGVTDYLACIAIFNNVTRKWLRDDVNINQFDKLRSNWETWQGNPEFWAFAALNKAAVTPKQEIVTVTDTFDLYYWATAPTVVDGNAPLVAADMQTLFEQYSVGELLESVKEFSKAQMNFADYYSNLEDYIERTKSLARGDLRLLI